MASLFRVTNYGWGLEPKARTTVYLVRNSWDDFGYKTTFGLVVVPASGFPINIGDVKIGQFELEVDQGGPALPEEFNDLGPEYFSLGQDDKYYEKLNELPARLGRRILNALQDLALDRKRFERAYAEKVTQVSLLRDLRASTVQKQFSRLARGGVRLSSYSFVFSPPRKKVDVAPQVELGFEVVPELMPPTNVHVLIGGNGVGKTYLLQKMAQAFLNARESPASAGTFRSTSRDAKGSKVFSGLVLVGFSAFDAFDLPLEATLAENRLRFAFVGLHSGAFGGGTASKAPRPIDDLADVFSTSIKVCMKGGRAERWQDAVKILESDVLIRDVNFGSLVEDGLDVEQVSRRAREKFLKLSSGHKIVLLTMARLVELVEEETLVLLDEPETHLHPPLLSSFIRALSSLMANRNGVAILATHSPVVLQEVPKKCVWKLRRNGNRLRGERPVGEVFGENVGVLTREVFGLEATDAGFHALIRDAVETNGDFPSVLDHFHGNLGGEARAIAMALLASRDRRG